MKSVFERYPQLSTIRGLVPDDIVEKEVGGHADEFERTYARAKEKIPIVVLAKIFPSQLELGRIVLEHFLGHWGNVSVEELCKISLIVKWLKPRRMLEIGTYNGM